MNIFSMCLDCYYWTKVAKGEIHRKYCAKLKKHTDSVHICGYWRVKK